MTRGIAGEGVRRQQAVSGRWEIGRECFVLGRNGSQPKDRVPWSIPRAHLPILLKDRIQHVLIQLFVRFISGRNVSVFVADLIPAE